MKKIFIILSLLIFCFKALAYRDSNIDNLKECQLNKDSLLKSKVEVSCNDLYHYYEAKSFTKLSRRVSSFKMGAFNAFKLGLGDSRFKDYRLTANILKNYDLIAVSELQHSASEELKSNLNLRKNPDLDFTKHYHKPGYLKLLIELRKSNSSWSLILSPAGQSDTEELAGFYFRADRVQLKNSKYCREHSLKIRREDNLVFAGGYKGVGFSRKSIIPHFDKSYACLLNIKESENELFRVPFSARFKVGSGFDFQMLAYHARFQAPISIGGSCGFECLEKVSLFLNETFHKKGSFLKILDYRAMRFLKNHLDFLSLSKDTNYALHEENSPIIKFKYSKPRVYENLLLVKKSLQTQLLKVSLAVWKGSYEGKISIKDRTFITNHLKELFVSLDGYKEFEAFIKEKGSLYKKFLTDVFNSGVFAAVKERYSISISPEKIARFKEVSLISREMEKIAKLERDRDVILGGDLNLEDSKNKYYWEYLKDNYEYSTVAISALTSIGDTNGLKSAYDHFIYDEKNSLEECQPLESKTLDFVANRSYWKGFEDYFVKSRSEIDKLSKKKFKELSQINFINSKGELVPANKMMSSVGYTSCWDGKKHKPASLAEIWKSKFECKTLNQYLNGPQRYRVFSDLVSDHLPIGMTCNKTADID